MPDLADKFFDWFAPQEADGEAAPPPSPPRDGDDRRVIGAAVGLAVAGAAAPIAVSATAATSGLLGPPLVASALAALLVLAPAGVGLAAALYGLRRIAAALPAPGNREAEHAMLRVFAGMLLFGYSLVSTAAMPGAGVPPAGAIVAALGLVAAWAILLQIILWPLAPPLRRAAAMAFDIVLLSALLHFGGGAVAGWFPLYLAAIFYAGFRFGVGALMGVAVAAVLGFAAVVASTAFWQQEPGLAIGLLIALAGLPAVMAAPIRAAAAALAATAAGDAERRGTLLLIADNLRAGLATTVAVGDGTKATAPQIGDVAEFAALQAGALAAPIESFDLRAAVRESLAPLRANAAASGVVLRWRIDPHLPLRLRGRGRMLMRMLESLAAQAIAATPSGTVRIALDPAAVDANSVRLRLRLDVPGGAQALGQDRLAVRLVERMAMAMDGRFTVDREADRHAALTLTVPLAIEPGAGMPSLDLGGCPTLIATEDGELAAAMAAMLGAWRGDPRWVGDGDAALAELAQLDAAPRPVAIVDGRRRLLSALGFVHRAAQLGADAPLVLLIAEPAQIDSLAAFDEGELDGFIPTPVTEALLAAALDALPLSPQPPRFADSPAAPWPDGEAEMTDETAARITSIATHPRFASETTAAVDARAIEGLRALGGGPGFAGFLGELIQGFRDEARQVMERLTEAVAADDAAGFERGLAALRRSAGPLGGTQLCEVLLSLQSLTPGELRQRGALHLQRLDAEIERLTAALLDFLPVSEARRP